MKIMLKQENISFPFSKFLNFSLTGDTGSLVGVRFAQRHFRNGFRHLKIAVRQQNGGGKNGWRDDDADIGVGSFARQTALRRGGGAKEKSVGRERHS